jgi:hypothetical protein
MKKLRIREIVALLVIGDRVLDLVRSRREAGFLQRRRSVGHRMMDFVRRNRVTLALGAVEVATGLWWSARQRGARHA